MVAQGPHFAVEDEALEVDVCGAEACQAGRLVTAAGFEADEAVFDNVDAADAVAAGDGVGGEEEVDGVGDGLLAAFFGVDQFSRQTLFEVEGEVFGCVRGFGRVHRELPHVLWRCGIWIFEDACLVAAVGEVLIHGPWFALRAGDWDVHLGGIIEQIVTAGEPVVKLRNAPWGNNFDGGLEGIEGEFEADLVVPFAGASVRDGNTVFLLRYGYLTSGDDGPGKGGP